MRKDGRVVRMRGTLQDITAQKQSEDALQRFMQASPMIVYGLAVESDRQRLIRLEGDIERLTGWKADEVDAGTWWEQNLHPEDRERVLAHNPNPYDIDNLSIEFRFRRADGRYIWIHDERRLLRDAQGRPNEVVGTWLDVTERVELETQLRQSQKLEAIGLLAGGIAHDFNNLLTVIIGTSEMLGSALADRGDILGFVEDIRAAGERAASLTRQLLAFSRKQVLQAVPVDINEAIDGLDRMLRRLIGEHITVRCNLEPGVGHAVVDPGQFQQVLVNLAVNARDAMPRGGSLTLATNLVDAKAVMPAGTATQGRYICVILRDTGQGMTPEVMERIFEPFFTTKAVGQGTGLGLATVFGIVQQSGGHIHVESTPDVGTTFRVYLPAASLRSVQSTPAAIARRGKETILLVDDEEGVRRIAALSLSRHGYTVVEATSPRDALLRGSSNEPINLLLTDVVMPDISGPELALALRAQRPTLKVLFMSGYVDESLERQGLHMVPHALLVKPFSVRELTARVRQVLDEGP
ncbi:MAG: ATP-binding protein [Vicinamibacterales bacterium]